MPGVVPPMSPYLTQSCVAMLNFSYAVTRLSRPAVGVIMPLFGSSNMSPLRPPVLQVLAGVWAVSGYRKTGVFVHKIWVSSRIHLAGLRNCVIKHLPFGWLHF